MSAGRTTIIDGDDMTRHTKSWKHLDIGFIDAKLRDANGRVIWGFKSRGQRNAADGFYAMAQVMMEKYDIDIVSMMEEMRRNHEKLDAAMRARVEKDETL
jgi:hypothetical protein